MLTANKSFQLTKDRHFERGQVIPPDVWNGLRRRTQDALKSARYVIHVEDSAASEGKQKRGK